jgi:drug/metabolite transporter (DMT)-like permease
MRMPVRVLATLLLSIVLGASGQLMFKAASRSLPSFAEIGLPRLLLYLFSTPLILAGFACFFLSAVLWIISLRSVALSTAYPMVALSYVIIFAGSALLFNEQIGWRHIAGAVLIVAGILLINMRP